MSQHSLQNKAILTLHVALSIAHAATYLLSMFLPNLKFINLALMVSALISATILCKRWEADEEEGE